MEPEPEKRNEQRADEEEVPERWSAKRKAEVVIRLLRGDSMEFLSRELRIPMHELEEWRRVFLEAGTSGLKSRGPGGREAELQRARAKIGELMMVNELQRGLLEKRGYGDDLRRLQL